MPVTRGYICDDCDHTFDAVQQFNDDNLKVCPECGNPSLYQDLSGRYVSVVGEPLTIGQVADRNTKKMGKYELEQKMMEDGVPEKIEKRKKQEKLNKINKMTPEQKTKYIFEGE